MSRKAPLLVLAAAFTLAGFATVANAEEAPEQQRQAVEYTPTNAAIANPERGFYKQPGDCDKGEWSSGTLAGWRRDQQISLIMCIFYLEDFKTSPISDAALGRLQRQLDSMRTAGVKAVLRFAYNQNANDNTDASKDRVVAHLDQLQPVLQRNEDVIAVVQAGIVGTWGEWYYTKNFGNEGNVSEQDWANRKAVTDKLLEVLPASRQIQLRTPKIKRTIYGTGAVDRVGHHNDCFLASDTDQGTYEDKAVEYPYLAQDTRSRPMGGETCAVSAPRSQCPTATEELAEFHWSFLNRDYQPQVLSGFESGGCMPAINNKLGYRLALVDGTFPATAQSGGELPIAVKIRNEGYAAPFNPRDVNLVLRNESGETQRIKLNADPRTFAAGETATVNETVTVPSSMAAGTYQLALELPDPLLRDRPDYSIRLANEGTWDAATGLNDLKATVTIS